MGTTFKVSGVTWPGIEPMTYQRQGDTLPPDL